MYLDIARPCHTILFTRLVVYNVIRCIKQSAFFIALVCVQVDKLIIVLTLDLVYIMITLSKVQLNIDADHRQNCCTRYQHYVDAAVSCWNQISNRLNQIRISYSGAAILDFFFISGIVRAPSDKCYCASIALKIYIIHM